MKDVMTQHLSLTVSEQILRRIRNEYIEMPGLKLTVRQAQRLWGLDAETCSQAIELLVEAKFLCRTGVECYTRLTETYSNGYGNEMT
jgi:hypothetical protein